MLAVRALSYSIIWRKSLVNKSLIQFKLPNTHTHNVSKAHVTVRYSKVI